MTAGRTLVAGATGALGREVVRELVAHGVEVRALVRDRARAGTVLPTEVELVVGDLRDGDAATRAVDGVERVVSTVGGPVTPSLMPWASFRTLDVAPNRALIDAAARAGVKRFAYASVSGAGERGRGAYLDAHTEVEELLAASSLAATVVRPTGYFSAFDFLIDLTRGGGTPPVLGRGDVKTNPIADRDLAVVMLDALDAGENLVEVGGPETLTRREIGELACTAVRREARTRSVPLGVVRVMAALATPLHPRNAALMKFFVRLHERDCTAPPRGTTTLAEHFASRAAA